MRSLWCNSTKINIGFQPNFHQIFKSRTLNFKNYREPTFAVFTRCISFCTSIFVICESKLNERKHDSEREYEDSFRRRTKLVNCGGAKVERKVRKASQQIGISLLMIFASSVFVLAQSTQYASHVVFLNFLNFFKLLGLKIAYSQILACVEVRDVDF